MSSSATIEKRSQWPELCMHCVQKLKVKVGLNYSERCSIFVMMCQRGEDQYQSFIDVIINDLLNGFSNELITCIF